MQQFDDIANDIINNGRLHENRTGVDTLRINGAQMHFDLKDGFPALTTNQTYLKGGIVELCWMLRGLTNVDYLHQHGVKFWDKWALREEDIVNNPNPFNMKVGDLGPVYGELWRRFPNGDGTYTDQIAELQRKLVEYTGSRRHVVSLWFPHYLPDEKYSPRQNVLLGKQSLAPCHWNFEVMIDQFTREELATNLNSIFDRDESLESYQARCKARGISTAKLNLAYHLR